LIVGQCQLWRIDPTGQFWNCHAAVLGRAADKAQEELYQQLLEACGGSSEKLVDYLQTWSSDEAIQLVSKCMEKVLFPKAQQMIATAASPTEAAKLMPKIHWQGVVVDYSSSMRKPKKTSLRGAFLPPGLGER
jgi:20S proteasome alpha/beta subunit